MIKGLSELSSVTFRTLTAVTALTLFTYLWIDREGRSENKNKNLECFKIKIEAFKMVINNYFFKFMKKLGTFEIQK